MKRIILWILVGTFILSSCTGVQKTGKTYESKELSEIKWDSPEYENLRVKGGLDEKFIQALWTFAAETTEHIMVEEKNYNYSPLSLYTALAMCQSGAKGPTQEELLSVLHMESEEALNKNVGNLYQWMHVEGQGDKVLMGNSIWQNSQEGDWELGEAFKETLDAYYHADIYALPFGEKSSDQKIKDWIKKKTQGHLDAEIKTDPNTAMTLLNTVYFLGTWSSEFDKNLTEDKPFYLSKKEMVFVPTMTQILEGSFYQGEDYTRGRIDFNEATMTFVLPKEGKDVGDFLKNKDQWIKVFKEGEDEWVDLDISLPKFDMKSDLPLLEVMQKLGMNLSTSGQADFSPMGLDLFIADIQQQSRITLKEEGVEASAVTEVTMEKSAMPAEEPVQRELKLDRPFIYVIEYQNLPLFVGVVENPLP